MKHADKWMVVKYESDDENNESLKESAILSDKNLTDFEKIKNYHHELNKNDNKERQIQKAKDKKEHKKKEELIKEVVENFNNKKLDDLKDRQTKRKEDDLPLETLKEAESVFSNIVKKGKFEKLKKTKKTKSKTLVTTDLFNNSSLLRTVSDNTRKKKTERENKKSEQENNDNVTQSFVNKLVKFSRIGQPNLEISTPINTVEKQDPFNVTMHEAD